jgi:GNAT superfamily N-acetyltransferase
MCGWLKRKVIAGYLVITWGWGIESGGREALIDEIYVTPEYRGQGLASALIYASLEKAKALRHQSGVFRDRGSKPRI